MVIQIQEATGNVAIVLRVVGNLFDILVRRRGRVFLRNYITSAFQESIQPRVDEKQRSHPGDVMSCFDLNHPKGHSVRAISLNTT